jgi:hypothetical protein
VVPLTTDVRSSVVWTIAVNPDVLHGDVLDVCVTVVQSCIPATQVAVEGSPADSNKEHALALSNRKHYDRTLKNFPLKDGPAIVNGLTTDGIPHLGIQIDLSQSFASLVDPATGDVDTHHRFAVNLATGEMEVASSMHLVGRSNA